MENSLQIFHNQISVPLPNNSNKTTQKAQMKLLYTIWNEYLNSLCTEKLMQGSIMKSQMAKWS